MINGYVVRLKSDRTYLHRNSGSNTRGRESSIPCGYGTPDIGQAKIFSEPTKAQLQIRSLCRWFREQHEDNFEVVPIEITEVLHGV
jgi:hypothetical protein